MVRALCQDCGAVYEISAWGMPWTIRNECGLRCLKLILSYACVCVSHVMHVCVCVCVYVYVCVCMCVCVCLSMCIVYIYVYLQL